MQLPSTIVSPSPRSYKFHLEVNITYKFPLSRQQQLKNSIMYSVKHAECNITLTSTWEQKILNKHISE